MFDEATLLEWYVRAAVIWFGLGLIGGVLAAIKLFIQSHLTDYGRGDVQGLEISLIIVVATVLGPISFILLLPAAVSGSSKEESR